MSEREIINTYDQLRAAGGGVAIVPSYSGTRTQYFYGWGILRVNDKGKQVITDPAAHWTDNGKKVFSASFGTEGDTRAERSRNALAQAKQWVAEQGWYNGEWTRNRMRDYVPKEINKRFPLRKDSK